MTKLKVSLVTPVGQVARVEAEMVTAPSVMGELGILADHRSLLADLVAGPVTVRTGTGMETFAVSGGFIEVDRNSVTLLVETAEAASGIDVERSKAALKDAEKKLEKLEYNTPDYNEEWARAKRARVRLTVAGVHGVR
jgi:F-type H+-transporting ATPase subunit epsilon